MSLFIRILDVDLMYQLQEAWRMQYPHMDEKLIQELADKDFKEYKTRQKQRCNHDD